MPVELLLQQMLKLPILKLLMNTALSFENTKYLDLDGSFDLERDIVSGGFNLKNGVLQPLDSPGLGVKLL